jgi:hypothetical protein
MKGVGGVLPHEGRVVGDTLLMIILRLCSPLHRRWSEMAPSSGRGEGCDLGRGMALRSIDPLYEVLPIFSFLQEDLVALGLDLLELHLHSCTKEPHDEPG